MPLLEYGTGTSPEPDPWIPWMWLGNWVTPDDMRWYIGEKEWLVYKHALRVGQFKWIAAHGKGDAQRLAINAIPQVMSDYKKAYNSVFGKGRTK